MDRIDAGEPQDKNSAGHLDDIHRSLGVSGMSDALGRSIGNWCGEHFDLPGIRGTGPMLAQDCILFRVKSCRVERRQSGSYPHLWSCLLLALLMFLAASETAGGGSVWPVMDG